MTVHEALQAIVDNKREKSLNYAVNYAIVGLGMIGGTLFYQEAEEELRVQCLYVLNNISRWRGPLAKQVRETLKKGAMKKC